MDELPITDPSIHANLLLESKEDVFKKYSVVQVLGNGSMGTVSKVKIKKHKVGGSAFQPKSKGVFGFLKKQNNKRKEGETREHNSQDYIYALKSIILDRVSSVFLDELRNEILILRSLDHPNIVKAHEVYYTRKQIYLVLELCDGGDLYTRSPYSERESARILQQILSAVRYMHDHGIVHRDLKFENIMFENNSPSARVKIIDFGLSKKFLGKPSYMTERVGTVYTMAPQVLQGVYSSQADLWSTGVIAYMLLSASKPFYHKRRRKMIDQIMRADFGYNAPVWKQISESAQDFVSRLLVVDPKKRLNAEKALDHSWIVNRERLPDETPSEDLLAAVDDCLVNYRQTSELKKLALNMIAHRSTAEEIMQLRKVFDSYDTSNDGIITFDEFKAALHKMNYPDEIVQEVFSSIDVNRNGHIQYTEFIASTVLAQGHIAEDRVAVAFDRLDSDDTGFISKKNLQNALGKEYTPELVENILEEVDTDRDGKISYTEFLQYFRKETSNLADRASLLEQQSSHVSEHGLVGLDAKIPGGPYDPNRT